VVIGKAKQDTLSACTAETRLIVEPDPGILHVVVLDRLPHHRGIESGFVVKRCRPIDHSARQLHGWLFPLARFVLDRGGERIERVGEVRYVLKRRLANEVRELAGLRTVATEDSPSLASLYRQH
jgi:hypothetical protein